MANPHTDRPNFHFTKILFKHNIFSSNHTHNKSRGFAESSPIFINDKDNSFLFTVPFQDITEVTFKLINICELR